MFLLVALLFSLCLSQFAFKFSKEVTDETIGEVIKAGHPVLLNAGVSFLGACKEFFYDWEEIGRTLAGKVTVAHIDIMHSPLTKARLNIRNFPILVLIRDGKVFQFETEGPDLNKDADIVSKVVAFAITAGESGEKSKPLPSAPFITQWFTTPDKFIGKDGKVYKGPSF